MVSDGNSGSTVRISAFDCRYVVGSLFAILFALPFGLSVSIYMSEVANPKVRSWLKPIIELLSGIPSVVYGFFGLIVIVPLIQKLFDLPVGESGLAGSVVLAIMALPTIITVTEDAMKNCPRAMREASLALGASQWQTIYKVVIPYSISGITSGVVLGIGRAIGETMAVLMVTGNAAVIPTTILEPLRTIPATIAAELGEAPAGGPHYQALFMLGVVLFFITLIINFSVEYISSKGLNVVNKMEICSNNKAKHRSQKLAFGIFRLLSLCIVLILFAILGFIYIKAVVLSVGSLSLQHLRTV